ncbi:MAG: helix-turn-helix domain-containing protein [Acidobacteria bacterium]|nr:helix-turn-helix domain-containing protein [Acidobacteriota bacterium]
MNEANPLKTISIRAAARKLGVHENTIRNWIDRHIIAAFRLPTGVRRVPETEIDRLARGMLIVPSSFPEDRIGPAPKRAEGPGDRTLRSYPRR